MLWAAIFYIATVIFIKELVIATDQCTEYQFKSPFYPGVSCEDIYNKNPESRDKPGYYWILDGPSRVYCGMNYTGSSCEDIYKEAGDKPGFYRISDNQWTYCNMTLFAFANDTFISTCAGVGGGWRRIVNINISAGDDCPTGWTKATQFGVSFCRVTSDSNQVCSSASFSTNEISYQRVCGRARGYQKGDTVAFYGSSFDKTIENDYVSGLSITYGSDPRKHVWTFAAGYSEQLNDNDNCPCTINPGRAPPSFVGRQYYCESASVNIPTSGQYYFNDVLWDGAGCVVGNKCCDDTTQPWFYRQLNQTTQDDIEARICAYDQFSSSSTLIDLLELYIQ